MLLSWRVCTVSLSICLQANIYKVSWAGLYRWGWGYSKVQGGILSCTHVTPAVAQPSISELIIHTQPLWNNSDLMQTTHTAPFRKRCTCSPLLDRKGSHPWQQLDSCAPFFLILIDTSSQWLIGATASLQLCDWPVFCPIRVKKSQCNLNMNVRLKTGISPTFFVIINAQYSIEGCAEE